MQKENEDLSNYLGEHFNVTDERYWWAAQSYRAIDKIPYIDKLAEDVYFLTGFSTDGLVYGTLGAEIIADQILGKENRWAHLFDLKSHSILKGLSTFAKEGIDNFYQYAKDLPHIGTSSPEEIAPGDGKIIEHEGEKMAVYCDEHGTKHAVSAVCTHMKCIVSFNKTEKTWDCPCHASRFRTDGTVIEGPAIYPLKRMDYEDTELVDRTVRGSSFSRSVPSERSLSRKRDT